MTKMIRVAELFAGVGGFRLGLEGWKGRSASSGYTEPIVSNYEVVWSNQWEPSTKVQHASRIYRLRFGPHNHVDNDIALVPASTIPEHDLLVGGFPCQDYSVARTLKNAKGLEGKKGVLWWEIHRILTEKRPNYVFLENVDRLIKSPAVQRGRDFAIMLASLSDLGYVVEWRVINAAEYGMPQRRRRIFILAYLNTSTVGRDLRNHEPSKVIQEAGVFAEGFPIETFQPSGVKSFDLEGELDKISENFNTAGSLIKIRSSLGFEDLVNLKGASPFENSGFMVERRVSSVRTVPHYTGARVNLGDLILRNGSVPTQYFIQNDELERWIYLKGAKNERRTNKASGFEYSYNEGPMTFPDSLDAPSRTIITGEGGSGASRFKHVINTPEGKLRRLTPIELERLNMFPDDHTAGVPDHRRAFFMGNALVVGIVEKVGSVLSQRMGDERNEDR